MAEKLPFGEGASINRPPMFCSKIGFKTKKNWFPEA